MSGNFLPILSMGFQAAGSLAQGFGAKAEAEAQARADEENARRALMNGEHDVLSILRQERMEAGAAIADMAGSGLALGSGSAAALIAQSALNRDRDISARRHQAAQEDAGLRQQAADSRAAGRHALINGVFGAVAGVVSGAADIRARRINAETRKTERKVMLGRARMG